MNILYISSSIIPSKNANSVNVMKMCSGLASLGHNVTLIATSGDKTINSYEYYNVHENFKLVLTIPLPYGLSGITRLVAGIRNSKNVDIVMTRWPLAAGVLRMISSKKIIYDYHGKPTKRLNKQLYKSFIRSPKIIRHIFNTHSLKNYYNQEFQLPPGKVLVLPNGADEPKVKLQPKERIDTSNISCGYVGSFNTGKGVDQIIEMAEKLPEVKFHVVGGSEQEVNLYRQKNINNNIEFYGFLPQKEAMQILANVDIALLPNQPKVLIGSNGNDIGDVTSPIKLFEYMAMGKAIIASDLPVIREVLRPNENALLAHHANVNEWVSAIYKLAEDKTLFNTISNQAKNDFENNYTWANRAKLSIEGLALNN